MKTRDITNHSLTNELASLPTEERQEVFDFIAFIRQRHARMRHRAPDEAPSLKHEPFLGIWSDRTDMKDSLGWVREVREREWAENGH